MDLTAAFPSRRFVKTNTRDMVGSWTGEPQGGKLDDESIRNLCDGQYMIHQPGHHQMFCRFDNVTEYGDNVTQNKHCSFSYDADPFEYRELDAEEGTAFGFSTGMDGMLTRPLTESGHVFSGVGTYGFVTQLGYLLRGICIHNKSHNLHLILGLNYAYIFPGVGTSGSRMATTR